MLRLFKLHGIVKKLQEFLLLSGQTGWAHGSMLNASSKFALQLTPSCEHATLCTQL